MKSSILTFLRIPLLAVAVLTTLSLAPPLEARDHRHRKHSSHRHSSSHHHHSSHVCGVKFCGDHCHHHQHIFSHCGKRYLCTGHR